MNLNEQVSILGDGFVKVNEVLKVLIDLAEKSQERDKRFFEQLQRLVTQCKELATVSQGMAHALQDIDARIARLEKWETN